MGCGGADGGEDDGVHRGGALGHLDDEGGDVEHVVDGRGPAHDEAGVAEVGVIGEEDHRLRPERPADGQVDELQRGDRIGQPGRRRRRVVKGMRHAASSRSEIGRGSLPGTLGKGCYTVTCSGR